MVLGSRRGSDTIWNITEALLKLLCQWTKAMATDLRMQKVLYS
jgi:hypothetical protein